MAKVISSKKPVQVVDDEDDVPATTKKPAKKVPVQVEDDDEEVDAPKAKKLESPKKEKAEPTESKSAGKPGLTKATEESGTITFKEGSGSAQMLSLIIKHNGNKETILKEAEMLKKAGKAFENCEPKKKLPIMIQLINTLKHKGFKLPKA